MEDHMKFINKNIFIQLFINSRDPICLLYVFQNFANYIEKASRVF